MRIGLDARFWGLENSGLGRYAMNLVLNLAEIDQKNQYFLFLRQKYFDSPPELPNNFHPVLAEIPPHSIAEQIRFPQIIKQQKLDFIHYLFFITPLLCHTPFVVTIHDLIKHRHSGGEATTLPKPVYYAKYLAYRLDIWWAIHQSRKIIVPTQHVKEDILRNYRLQKEKIEITYEGFDPHLKINHKEPLKILAKYQIKKPYLIYVGNVYPYKNIPRMIEALRYLPEEIRLVIVCARSVFWKKIEKIIQEKKLTSRVISAGFVPDDDLGTLYQESLAFISSSLDEGFGITPLEAMGTGTPVIVSDYTCFPETCQKAALYFDPFDPQNIADRVRKIYQDTALREKLILEGQKNLQRFSWEKMAEETLQIYQKTKTNS